MSSLNRRLVRVGMPVTLITLCVALWMPSAVRAADNPPDPRIQTGLNISPVLLNLVGRDQDLVGLGSYLVNSAAGCNDCHSNGPQTQYAPGGNPFFGQPARTNPATFMGGGRDFGALIPGSAHIVSRNLTPDKSGMPEGGRTLAEFTRILRTGTDLDHLHPTCTGTPNENCIPRPFNGDLLQIMPWPNYKDLTDREIAALYEYLSAIPCIEGGPGEPSNRCASETARLIWIAPGTLTGFGDRGSLIVAGVAGGPVPAGTRVTLYWRDITSGTGWTAVPYTAAADPPGIWFNAVPAASTDFTHQYEMYAVYGHATSAPCTYTGNGVVNSCP